MKLPQRPLGSTGLSVSVLGLGTVKFGRNQKIKYPTFELPSDEAICQLLDDACSYGINLLDTSPAYGIAEERMGKLLGTRRNEFVIVTKTGEEFANGESTYDFSA
ncbi:MAG TPA: aldo/keto reductase, partial [Candidatus Limnocylindria bacterium]|nr:aldo/keto reductase [Candidatus Limnocylindria bacterium]